MYFFGHVGITVGLVHTLNHLRIKKRKTTVDLRWAALLSLGADLIDKPVALLYKNSFENHTRLLGHNCWLTLSSLMIVLVIFFRYRRHFITALTLWACFAFHMALDLMWTPPNPQIYFFPLMGHPGPMPENILGRWYNTLFTPYIMFGEIFGFTILAFLFKRYQLFKTKNMRKFILTGRL